MSADPVTWRKATAELRSMERRVTAGKLTPAQLADTAGLVSGALSAAATRPEYSRGEIPKAARDAGRMAASRAKGAPALRLPLAAALIFLQAQDRDGSLAQTVMVRQLLSTYRAVQDARRAKARETGMSMGEPDGLDEVADVGVTMGVTTAAVGWEKHSRAVEDQAREQEKAKRTPAKPTAKLDDQSTPTKVTEGTESATADPERTDPKTRPPSEWKTGGEPLKPAQRAVLLNRGVPESELAGMTKAQASERISAKRQTGNVVTMPPPDPQRIRTETRGHGRRR